MKHIDSFTFIVLLIVSRLSHADDNLSYLKEKSQIQIFQDNSVIQNLVQLSIDKKLHSERTWRKLLHYESTIFLNTVSQVKDPAFFLSEQGDKKSDRELISTLIGFFGAVDLKDKHAICRFPARLAWLKEKLKDHPAWTQLPKPICLYQDIYLRNLNAASISYVFSSYYANNPGSAFGHTFFRINKKAKEGKAKQELLDYGISYAAQVTTGNSLLYMINGLTGAFKGTYASVPYYYKVREYNDYESRDLWAYELELSEAEVSQVVNHLWELGPHYFDYYFFTQNCSYHMLTVLEAASARIELTDKVPLYVIPSDSVKALFQLPGFVRKSEFRPSLRRHFENKWSLLNENEKENFVSLLNEYSENKLRSFQFPTLQQKAHFYDTLIDYTDMKDPNGIANRQGTWHGIKEFVLLNRAEIPVISEDIAIATPEQERPEKSHPSGRLSIGAGGGQSKTHGYFQYRFAFHELLDDSKGLPVHSQLEFFNFKFHLLDNDFNLENFSFFNILQLNPLRQIDPQPSWGVDVGIRNMNLCRAVSCLGSGIQAYGGYTLLTGKHLIWALPFFHYRYGNNFELTPNYLALGFKLGYLYEYSQKIKLMLNYGKEIPNKFKTTDFANANARYNFNYQNSVEVEWQSQRLQDAENNQLVKLLYHYFY